MRTRSWRILGAAAGVALAAGCSFLTDLDGLSQPSGTGDAGAEADVVDAPPPATGFTIAVAPAHVTADRGDPSVSVTVSAVRAADFTGPITITLNGVPPAAGITGVSSLTLSGTTTSGPVTFAIDGKATTGDYTIDVLGQSGAFTASAHFGLRVDSVLFMGAKSTTLTVPAYATALDVQAWGGGGGAGGYHGYANGGNGGAGGFSAAHLTVAPGASLDVLVATGGGAGSSYSGGGGGYSAVKTGSTYLLVAGGGGGGGGSSGGHTGNNGAEGHGNSPAGGCAGGSGTATKGGAGGTGSSLNGAPGTQLMGGASAGQSAGNGGAPGGGSGGYGGAGGGGGYWGGGAGAPCSPQSQGGRGGGGSGYVVAGAANVVIAAGAGPLAPHSGDPDYQPSGGAAVGGADAGINDNGAPGTGGWVVIRLPKP